MTTVLFCPAGHVLSESADTSPWSCDGASGDSYCRSGIKPDEEAPTCIARYRCLECDFDLCGLCHAQEILVPTSDGHVLVSDVLAYGIDSNYNNGTWDHEKVASVFAAMSATKEDEEDDEDDEDDEDEAIRSRTKRRRLILEDANAAQEVLEFLSRPTSADRDKVEDIAREALYLGDD